MSAPRESAYRARFLPPRALFVSTKASSTSTRIALCAATGSAASMASYTRWWSGIGSRDNRFLRCLNMVVHVIAAEMPLVKLARKALLLARRSVE